MPRLIGKNCPCGSGMPQESCCEPSLDVIGLSVAGSSEGTYLLDWVDKHSAPICEAFDKKARPFGYRISRYLDGVLDTYLDAAYPTTVSLTDDTNEMFRCQKQNIALTITGAYRLLAEGMFVQSGVLLRTAIESSLVLLETATDPSCIDLLNKNKYKAQSVLKRVKDKVPANIIEWYGYFSANFTHVAAIHQAPYLPRACYPDNWVIVTGLQNIVRTIVSYHTLLERAYIDLIDDPFFWNVTVGSIQFNEDSKVFEWANSLGAEINKAIPTKARPLGMHYACKSVTLKV